MKVWEILTEAVIAYTLDNYKDMPNFSDENMGTKYKLHSYMKLMKVTNEKTSRIFDKYRPGTIVRVLGRTIQLSGQHFVVVNPIKTNDVYKIFGYYLQDPDTELTEPVIRLKKVLKGDLQCGNCGNIFSLSVPGGKHRDHCPLCLYSVHIDNKPGDRNAWCGAGTHDNWTPSKLVPVGITTLNHVPSIAYKCEKCGAVKINKNATDDNKQLLDKLPEVAVVKQRGRNAIMCSK